MRYIDTFTATPGHGNPAAVTILDADDARIDDETWLLTTAREQGKRGITATVFLRPTGTGAYRVRWFAPSIEIQLCGHGTLAATHVLATTTSDDRWTLESQHRGTLQTERLAEPDPSLAEALGAPLYRLTLPTPPVTPIGAIDESALREALGMDWKSLADADGKWLIELATAADVRAITPDQPALRSLNKWGAIVTARGDTDERADYVLRVFGHDGEDPATGSAHAAVAPWWARTLGGTRLHGHQPSASRGDVVVDCSAADTVDLLAAAVDQPAR